MRLYSKVPISMNASSQSSALSPNISSVLAWKWHFKFGAGVLAKAFVAAVT